MRNINALIKRFENLTECEECATYEYQGARSFYLLPDGRFLNCQGTYTERWDDHNLIFGATKIKDRYRNSKAWEQLHRNYRVVRLVPECGTALLKGRQRLTEEQKEAIESIGFEIERY